jgi:DNA-binding NarL/FixJ family response regulator
MTTIKVLLVDDQMLVREGIKSLLNLSPRVSVVGEARDGSEVLAAIERCQPDVILLDLSMPVMDGIATLEMLAEKKIKVPVIILTTFDDHDFILRGLQAGARGYLLKDVSLEKLIDAIETVQQGKHLVTPAITARLLDGLKGIKSEFEAPELTESLSPKEIEVLGLMASGCSNREIADTLSKSEGTIKNHVSNVLAKLGVRDRTRAVLIGIEKGLL